MYVARSKDLTLKYSKLPTFFLIGFSYYDYGGDRDDKKSTSAYEVLSLGPSRSSLLLLFPP